MEKEYFDSSMLLEEAFHSFEPGDWVRIKSFTRTSTLQPIWKEPYQILFITQTTIKVVKRDAWIHWSHVKPAVIDYSSDPGIQRKVPPIKLHKDLETDRWTLEDLFNNQNN